ncbi:hypothetical protein C8R47DRAFT_1210243 [Mycena vitilis]|nr:hypothetical protein C8R47DRAFT_1210243 [Mycena vitilis]
MFPTPLYVLTWISLLLSTLIFVTSIIDLGLWMNMSAGGVTVLYHLAVLVLSFRAPSVAPYDILASVPTAGCASLLVFAWLAAFAMTTLALVIGRDNFPGPPPLIPMAFPVHVSLGALTGVETVLVGVVARLSGVGVGDGETGVSMRARGALQRRIGMRPASAARRLLSVPQALEAQYQFPSSVLFRRITMTRAVPPSQSAVSIAPFIAPRHQARKLYRFLTRSSRGNCPTRARYALLLLLRSPTAHISAL